MKKGTILYGAVCFILGAAICGGSAAFAAGVTAERSRNVFYVDGERIELEAYLIDGTNYVRLRDVGEAVGFNVYWDGAVQIETNRPYTGVALEDDPLDENMDIRLEIVRLANAERQKAGVPPLTVNAALMDAAQDCAGQGFTSHNTEYECRAALKYGYPYGFGSNLTVFGGASEELAAAHAVRNWVNSKGHYETMTAARYRDIGVGVVIVDGRAYCYMLLGNPDSYNPYG